MDDLSLSLNSCVFKIRGQYSLLNAAEKTLADYILDNTGTVIHLTIEQLARQSGISYATIMRFCKKLGMNGYKEFKNMLTIDVIRDAKKESDFSLYDNSENSSRQSTCERVFELYSNILDDCSVLINYDRLEKAVNTILGANTLHIIGSGASAASAMYAQTRLLRLGVPCSCDYDQTIYMMKASLLRDGDVLLAISSSGRTASIVNTAKAAKERGAQIIGISDYATSPLNEASDVCLYTTPRNVNMFLNMDMPLTIGQIALIDIVYSCCSATLGEKGREYYMNTKIAADSNKI